MEYVNQVVLPKHGMIALIKYALIARKIVKLVLIRLFVLNVLMGLYYNTVAESAQTVALKDLLR
jgi:hypothetical protein